MQQYLRMLAVTGLVFALGVVGTLPSAHALQLRLNVGGQDTPIDDNGAGDSNPLTGAIVFNGSIGSFFIVVSTGLSKPLIGSADSPEMDFNSVEVSGGAGTLTAMLTDRYFTGIGSSQLSIGGTTTSGNVTYDAYFDSANAAFGGVGNPSNLLGTSGLLNGPAFSKTTLGSAPSGTYYSLTQVVKIVHTSPSTSVSSLDAHLKVPEPTLLSMLVMSFASVLGFGYSCRRRKR